MPPLELYNYHEIYTTFLCVDCSAFNLHVKAVHADIVRMCPRSFLQIIGLGFWPYIFM